MRAALGTNDVTRPRTMATISTPHIQAGKLGVGYSITPVTVLTTGWAGVTRDQP
jgi:hypothetical protein